MRRIARRRRMTQKRCCEKRLSTPSTTRRRLSNPSDPSDNAPNRTQSHHPSSGRGFFARVPRQHVLVAVVIEQLTELRLPIVLFRRSFRDLEMRHVGSLGRVNLVCHGSLQNMINLGGGTECTPGGTD